MRHFVTESKLTPKGHRQITDLSVAVGLTTPPAGTLIALIQAETANVRWRDDGVAPTASVGMLLEAGQDLVYTGDMAAIQFIQQTGGAKLNIAYYF